MTEVFGIKFGKKEAEEGEIVDTYDPVEEAKGFKLGTAGVDLIPPTVLDKYADITLRNRFLAAGLVVLLGFGGYYGYSKFTAGNTAEELAALEEQTSTIQDETRSFAGYETFYKEVDSKRTTLGSLLNTDVDTGAIIEAVRNAAANAGISLSTVNVTVAGAAAESKTADTASCASPDPFGEVQSAGCITFEATANDRLGVASFIIELNNTEGFVNAYIPSTSTSSQTEGQMSTTSASGSVAFTDFFYLSRFDDISTPLPDAITALLSGAEGVEGENPETDQQPTVDDGQQEAPQATETTESETNS